LTGEGGILEKGIRYQIFLNNDSEVVFKATFGEGEWTVNSTSAVPAREWTHIMVTNDQENVTRLYINGVEVGEVLSDTVLPINTLNNFAFNRGDNTELFFGKTKAIKVYKSIAEAQADLPYIT